MRISQLCTAQNLPPTHQSLDGSNWENGLAMANVRHYVIYDLNGRALEASTAARASENRMGRPRGFITALLGLIDTICRLADSHLLLGAATLSDGERSPLFEE